MLCNKKLSCSGSSSGWRLWQPIEPIVLYKAVKFGTLIRSGLKNIRTKFGPSDGNVTAPPLDQICA